MDTSSTRHGIARMRLFVKMARYSLVLLLLAGAIIGAGFYVQSRPEWLLRRDIREHNGGVDAYYELLWAPLIATEESLMAAYPHVIEKAGERFEKASSASSDNRVKSAALYNLGTVVGRVAFFGERLPGIDVSVAVTKLAEAVREDPTNEDAKYNLELLESKMTREELDATASGLGYGAGATEKSY